MARPRRQTYTMLQYLGKNQDGDISNDADTQRNPAWKSIINGLIVTALTDDYIPPIILAEEDNSQLHIVDGGSRTAALKMFLYGNWKISSSIETSIIQYKKKVKNENGDIIWEDAEFNIKNKTYEQLPVELKKKFDECQIETVIHEHCDKTKIAMYIKRYNEHSAMNTNQKMFIYIPNFAGEIRKIINRSFFLNYSDYKDIEKEKGVLERVVIESVMCMFHLDDWSKQGKKIALYLNEKSSNNEFNKLNNNLERLENIITDDIKDIFNSKNSFIWLTLFERFTKLNIDDSRFADFLREFKRKLRNKMVDGKLFDSVDDVGSTKDKAIIVSKLHILEILMNEFLHINEEDLKEVSSLEFIRENISPDITEKDIEQYEEVLEVLTLNVDNTSKLIDKHNRSSLVAMVAYSFENDIDLDDWIVDYFKRNNTYIRNQKENFLHMEEDLKKYISKKEGE